MRASTSLGMSVEESQRNLQLLKDAKKALNADLKDKRAASAVSFLYKTRNFLKFSKLKFKSRSQIPQLRIRINIPDPEYRNLKFQSRIPQLTSHKSYNEQ